MKIWKSKINVQPTQTLEIPIAEIENAIVDVSLQNGEPHIWYMANGESISKVNIYSYMTGEDVPQDLEPNNYLGSYVLQNGIRVHVFYNY